MLQRHSNRPRGDVENDDTPLSVGELFDLHAKTEPQQKGVLHFLRVQKGCGSNDSAGSKIRDAQDENTTPLVSECSAAAEQLVVIVILSRLFQFDVLVLGATVHPGLELLERRMHFGLRKAQPAYRNDGPESQSGSPSRTSNPLKWRA